MLRQSNATIGVLLGIEYNFWTKTAKYADTPEENASSTFCSYSLNLTMFTIVASSKKNVILLLIQRTVQQLRRFLVAF